jgi:ABC transporter transmembrane region 2
MELERHGADNPEQRIEQDIATFTTQTLNIMVGLLLQVMTLITFAAILFGITHRPELTGQNSQARTHRPDNCPLYMREIVVDRWRHWARAGLECGLQADVV